MLWFVLHQVSVYQLNCVVFFCIVPIEVNVLVN